MLFDNRNDFMARLPDGAQLLGLDVGSKTIGVAISDRTRILASPLLTIARKKFTNDLATLQNIIRGSAIAALVVGLPLSSDGSENQTSQSVRQFVRNLLKELDIPVLFWDERFSTLAAERTLLEADMSRQKRGQVIDKMAAAYILQGFLDSLDKNR